MTKDDTNLRERSVANIDEPNSPSFLDFQAEEYIGYIDEFDMTEAQKLELLETLFSIMYSFVQLGFDVKNCGQIFESFTQAAQGNSDAVDSSHSSNEEKPSAGGQSHE